MTGWCWFGVSVSSLIPPLFLLPFFSRSLRRIPHLLRWIPGFLLIWIAALISFRFILASVLGICAENMTDALDLTTWSVAWFGDRDLVTFYL